MQFTYFTYHDNFLIKKQISFEINNVFVLVHLMPFRSKHVASYSIKQTLS
jgi:hypothetical protein